MAAVPRSHVNVETAAEASCGARFATNVAVGTAVGVIGALGVLTFRAPSNNPKFNAVRAFRTLLYEIVPVTTGASAIYTAVACTVESNRGKRDWASTFTGGCATGFVVVGAKRGSLQSACLGCLGFGLAASSVDLVQSLNADMSDVRRKQVDAKLVTMSATPDAYGSNAASAAEYERKMLQ